MDVGTKEMREMFREFLREAGKAEKTSETYSRLIDYLSKHCGQNIFSIADVEMLRPLVRRYDSGGMDYDVGNIESGGARAAIKQYFAFLQENHYEKFDSDDEDYLAWIKSHPNGYVINSSARPSQKYQILHRASCPSIAETIGKAYIKVCAIRESGLQKWFADHQLGGITSRHHCIKDGITNAKPTSESNFDEMIAELLEDQPLNQILYGPPGTGKTHRTINETLAILDPDFLGIHIDNREELKRRFDELCDEGRVRFVTFHQSFSYEDFVEGLRAIPDEEGTLKYMPVDGVFRTLCQGAAAKVVVDQAPALDLTGRKIWKMSLGGRGSDESYIYDECIQTERVLLGWGGDIDFSKCNDKTDIVAAFHAAGTSHEKSDYAVTAVAAFVLKMKIGDLVIVSDGNYKFKAIGQVTGKYQRIDRTEENDDYGQCRSVRWLKVFEPAASCDLIMNKDFMMKTIYQLHPHVVDQQKVMALLASPANTETSTESSLAKVLIIDEINRGNISRIFGELITLLEPSKRAGSPEALSVTLPYSKEQFSVPKNLYIIGTMNTADKSLAGLDMALRRRFVFREMPPCPDLLEDVIVHGLNIGELLRTMNQRIEALLDRDHCLGHAYFMPLIEDRSLARLGSIFKQQIIPLLQEYFFEDWERIAWVLNDHRKPPINRFILEPSANIAALFGDDFDGKVVARSWSLNEEVFERLDAYLSIVNHNFTATLSTEAVAGLSSANLEQQAQHGEFTIRQQADLTVEVLKGGVLQAPAKPILRNIAKELGVSLFNGSGNEYNTRQLGGRVIQHLKGQA